MQTLELNDMNKLEKPTIIFIVGCTASGKGTVGRTLAQRFDAEILSIDSMKVYKLMDIGTGKPSKDIRDQIPHHLIDVIDPSESFSVGRFVELADQAIADVHQRGKITIAVGGTVLYLKGLTEGLFEGPSADPAIREELTRLAEERGNEFLYNELFRVDPETADRIHRNDLKRLVRALEVYRITGQPISSFQKQFGQLRDDYNMLFLGLRHEREQLNWRINERVRRMFRAGLVEEVMGLYHRQPPMSPQACDAVGYAEIFEYFEGKWDLPVAMEKVKVNTRRLAKTQRTWFRRMPHIRWIDVPADRTPEDFIPQIGDEVETWLGGLRG
jgi:tRNA dimethylallyltransferase